MTDEEFHAKLRLLKRLGWVALGGAILLVPVFAFGVDERGAYQTVTVVGMLALVPGVFYVVVFTIWHWKGRYIGKHSDLWGALLLIEVSGWFKLIYLFRHIIPDARGKGRYARAATRNVA